MAVTEALTNQLVECAEKQDFEGAFKLVREHQVELSKSLTSVGVRDALKKTTKDRLLLSFLDGAGFGEKPFDKAMVSLEKLVGFQEGALVLSKAWGLGKVKRLDYFYKRITVDFKVKKGHQFTYAAAVDMLEGAPEGHILVLRESDPAAFDTMLKEKPAEFVKAVLKSYGDMPITRLEDVCVANGFVKAVNWKKFWETARGDLRKDKLVEIPVKRADPIRLKASAEDYGDSWLTAFSHETDPKLILAAVCEYDAQGKLKNADESVRAKIGERLAFAVTAARKVDDAGFLVDEPVDLFIRAHEDDPVSLDAHGLGDLVPLVDRDDAAVFEGHVQVGEIKIHARSAFLFSSGMTRARRCPPSEAAGSVVSSLLSFRRIRRADTPPCRRSW